MPVKRHLPATAPNRSRPTVIEQQHTSYGGNMPATEQITITVSAEIAKLIRRAVACGEHPDASSFVEARVREFLDDDLPDEVLEREVLPVYDAMAADPAQGIPLGQARTRILERHKSYIRAAA